MIELIKAYWTVANALASSAFCFTYISIKYEGGDGIYHLGPIRVSEIQTRGQASVSRCMLCNCFAGADNFHRDYGLPKLQA